MNTYSIVYSLNGNKVYRYSVAKNFRDATINAATNATHRPSLRDAIIVSIKECNDV